MGFKTSPIPPSLVTFVSEERAHIWAWSRAQQSAGPHIAVHIYEGEWGECAAWRQAGGGSLLVIPTDSILSDLFKGTDLSFERYFGQAFFRHAQEYVWRSKHRPLLIGESVMRETGVPFFPYVLFVPVKDSLAGSDVTAPYRAMSAVLLHWSHGVFRGRPVRRFISSVIVPPFFDLDPKISSEVCARGQFAAFEECLSSSSSFTDMSHMQQLRDRLVGVAPSRGRQWVPDEDEF